MTPDFDEELERASEAIKRSIELVLLCHVDPDADALGSMLAFHQAARSHGIASVASWPGAPAFSRTYRSLPGVDEAASAELPKRASTVITFDCASAGRLDDLRGLVESADEVIVVDHHATNPGFGTINLIDAQAASAGVVVRKLLAKLDWELTAEIATCLYASLAADTGRFQYATTNAEVFDLARELVENGAPVTTLARELFEEQPLAALKLTGECLARSEFDADLSLLSTWVTRQDLERYGVELDDMEPLVDLLRRAAEAEVVCILKEHHESLRVSLRSLGDTDVSAIAGTFGGGGHRRAAGFTSRLDREQTLAQLKQVLSEVASA